MDVGLLIFGVAVGAFLTLLTLAVVVALARLDTIEDGLDAAERRDKANAAVVNANTDAISREIAGLLDRHMTHVHAAPGLEHATRGPIDTREG